MLDRVLHGRHPGVVALDLAYPVQPPGHVHALGAEDLLDPGHVHREEVDERGAGLVQRLADLVERGGRESEGRTGR